MSLQEKIHLKHLLEECSANMSELEKSDFNVFNNGIGYAHNIKNIMDMDYDFYFQNIHGLIVAESNMNYSFVQNLAKRGIDIVK